jgi:hypothetical protein
VPLPTWACALMLAPAMGLLVTIIAIPFYTLQWKVRRRSAAQLLQYRLTQASPPLPPPPLRLPPLRPLSAPCLR